MTDKTVTTKIYKVNNSTEREPFETSLMCNVLGEQSLSQNFIYIFEDDSQDE